MNAGITFCLAEVSVARTGKKAQDGGSKGDLTVNVEASARAAATAKYEVRKIVHENIPEDVSRAKAGAWLTIISPITQWAGLKGDQLAHKRAILRLQQEEALAEIATKANARIKNLKLAEPIPTKFLVPFLEKASLEDPNSDLIELWANLLVSAAENYHPHYTHFSNIIAQMSARQAEVFTQLIGADDARLVESTMDGLFFEFDPEFMKTYLVEIFEKKSKIFNDADNVVTLIDKSLNIVGTEIKYIELSDSRDDKYFSNGNISTSKYEDGYSVDYAILAALGLIKYVDTGKIVLQKRWTSQIQFYHVTSLGFEFAKACAIVREQSPTRGRKPGADRSGSA